GRGGRRWAGLPGGDFGYPGVGGRGGGAGEVASAGMAPDGVVTPAPQQHGGAGDGLVQPAGVEESTGDETAVIGGSGGPLLVRVGCGVAADLGDDLVAARTRAHLRAFSFHPAEDRMGMTVSEGRREAAAVEGAVVDP